jgi:hypothetical protein
MLVVRVEVWPGGDPTRRRQVGCAGIANVSGLNEVSDYVGLLTDDAGRQITVVVRGHRRAAGFWVLLAQACDPSAAASDTSSALVEQASEAIAKRLRRDSGQ